MADFARRPGARRGAPLTRRVYPPLADIEQLLQAAGRMVLVGWLYVDFGASKRHRLIRRYPNLLVVRFFVREPVTGGPAGSDSRPPRRTLCRRWYASEQLQLLPA